MKFGRSPIPTGYEAHAAAARDRERMAAAARQGVDEGVSFDDEMIEEHGSGRQPPHGGRFGNYGKAGGRGASERIASSHYDPLHGSRRQSPEMPDRRHPTPFSSVGHIPADPRTTRDFLPARGDNTPHRSSQHGSHSTIPEHLLPLILSIMLSESKIKAAGRHLRG